MWARLSIVAGLVAGVAVAGLVLGGILAFAPDPVSSSSPTPSLAVESPRLSTAPSVAASPTPIPSTSLSDAPVTP